MELLKLDISDISHHKKAAAELLEFAKDQRIFLFEAPMGSGKTTFIKALCEVLSVTDSMSSPTYSIVNEYYTESDAKVFHFDMYRLGSSQELFDLGFEDYISGNNYVFIEWPELAMPFLDSYLRIIITTEDNNRYLCARIIKSSQ